MKQVVSGYSVINNGKWRCVSANLKKFEPGNFAANLYLYRIFNRLPGGYTTVINCIKVSEDPVKTFLIS